MSRSAPKGLLADKNISRTVAKCCCFHVVSGPALSSFSVLMEKSQIKEAALLLRLFWIFPAKILERKQDIWLLPTEKNIQRNLRIYFKEIEYHMCLYVWKCAQKMRSEPYGSGLQTAVLLREVNNSKHWYIWAYWDSDVHILVLQETSWINKQTSERQKTKPA